jgi:8-oxo-dGTP diphosphatase
MKEKIILQNSAGIFLKQNGYYLLMKRSPEKKIAPGVWSCVGGHFEPDELNDPLATCLREAREETGILADRIFNPELRYIIIRRKEKTIWQTYVSRKSIFKSK